jgi:hypothetical protein
MHSCRYSSAQFLLDAGAAMDLKVAPQTVSKCSTSASHQPSVTRRRRRCIAGSCLCAIHFAAYHCRASVVRLLVEQGADVQVLDGRGRQAGAVFSAASALRWSCSSDRRLVSHFSAYVFSTRTCIVVRETCNFLSLANAVVDSYRNLLRYPHAQRARICLRSVKL